jgi:hypothetical protein
MRRNLSRGISTPLALLWLWRELRPAQISRKSLEYRQTRSLGFDLMMWEDMVNLLNGDFVELKQRELKYEPFFL